MNNLESEVTYEDTEEIRSLILGRAIRASSVLMKTNRETPRGLASATIRRRIEWAHTDAAGTYHWTTVPLLVEAAETELLATLGLAEQLYGSLPRANVQISYRLPLRFNDIVEVRLAVTDIRRTSLIYGFEVSRDGVIAAEGCLTIVYVDTEGRPAPLPDETRRKLMGNKL